MAVLMLAPKMVLVAVLAEAEAEMAETALALAEVLQLIVAPVADLADTAGTAGQILVVALALICTAQEIPVTVTAALVVL